MEEALFQHLQTGCTTVCRAWLVLRVDGMALGFTDHDEDLIFDGNVFRASSGLSTTVLEKSSGLAVDNSEVSGALSDASINEEDIMAGRYDGAEVTNYLVNWQDVDARMILFRGTFGEITVVDNMFRVELRGLSEPLNVRRGRVFHSECNAILGDTDCGVDLSDPRYFAEADIETIPDTVTFVVTDVSGYSEGWFSGGTASILTGRARGQTVRIASASSAHGTYVVKLTREFGLAPKTGDRIRLTAGCNRTAGTCREKFGNFLNFRGFPHIPGEDWIRSTPGRSNRR